ncbi:helix-turn-helix domain-containing protein [Actinomadura luteofluorescens]|uniref:helix-turn-helix domain-containing protein n=1 Tax=Actinomadura luteofluorescens TaxID=46163 RepID=UPI00364526B8
MRRLGTELRKLRESAGYTIEQVAEHLECSPSRVSRIETGKAQPPKQRELRDLLELFGASDARIQDALLQLAREAAQPGWYSEFQDVFPPHFGSYIGLESEATELRHFDNQLVHGYCKHPSTHVRCYGQLCLARRPRPSTDSWSSASPGNSSSSVPSRGSPYG